MLFGKLQYKLNIEKMAVVVGVKLGSYRQDISYILVDEWGHISEEFHGIQTDVLIEPYFSLIFKRPNGRNFSINVSLSKETQGQGYRGLYGVFPINAGFAMGIVSKKKK